MVDNNLASPVPSSILGAAGLENERDESRLQSVCLCWRGEHFLSSSTSSMINSPKYQGVPHTSLQGRTKAPVLISNEIV